MLDSRSTSSTKSSGSGKSSISLPSLKNVKFLKTDEDSISSFSELDVFCDQGIRDVRIRCLLDDYFQSKDFITVKHYIDHDLPENILPSQVPEGVLTMFSKVMAFYQIEYMVTDLDIQDSASYIQPVKKLNEVYYTMAVIMSEISKLPYSFYKKLKIRMLNFCSRVDLANPTKLSSFVRRYYNWNFMIKEHLTPQEIRRHFLYTVWFNVFKTLDNFETDWLKLYNKEKPKLGTELVLIPRSGKNNKDIKAPVYSIMDQFEIFYYLIEDPIKVLHNKDKIIAMRARLMKKALESFDSEGINEEWWSERGL